IKALKPENLEKEDVGGMIRKDIPKEKLEPCADGTLCLNDRINKAEIVQRTNSGFTGRERGLCGLLRCVGQRLRFRINAERKGDCLCFSRTKGSRTKLHHSRSRARIGSVCSEDMKALPIWNQMHCVHRP
nr:hypothetical protein [Tanacetum cinerariifolium]